MRFKDFSDKELDILEDALCCEYAGYYLIYEIRKERERRAELKGDNKQSRCNTCQNNTDELSGECYECVKGIEDWYEPLKENE